ncbi:MAG: flagellar assembly protein FliW [Methylobacter sp.]
MEIKSSFLGTQTVDPDTIINFPKGIPGFEDQTRFKLFHQEDSNDRCVYWLQSLSDESLTFSVAQPSVFNINYNFVLNDEEEATLGIENPADVLVLIILLKDSAEPTIKGSIKAPLIINSAKRLGLQKVLPHVEQSITLTDVSNQINVSECA